MTLQVPKQNNVFWCARYMSKLIDAFRSAYRQRRAATPGSDGQQQTGDGQQQTGDGQQQTGDGQQQTGDGQQTPDIVYFATTYPLPGVEPDKRFVVELR